MRPHFLTNKILFKLHYNHYHSFIKFLILLLTQGYVYSLVKVIKVIVTI